LTLGRTTRHTISSCSKLGLCGFQANETNFTDPSGDQIGEKASRVSQQIGHTSLARQLEGHDSGKGVQQAAIEGRHFEFSN
jgi:hypothetical protein